MAEAVFVSNLEQKDTPRFGLDPGLEFEQAGRDRHDCAAMEEVIVDLSDRLVSP
jgi:hypothetical protein